LVSIPKSLGKLNRLTWLDLMGNRLTSLPESLGQLTALARLDLERNDLTTLPESLLELRALEELYLHSNPKLELPEEVLGPTYDDSVSGSKAADPRAILAFYFAQQKKDAKPLNEVKLLLVGHGRVGKTSLSKALRGIPHDQLEPETPGIERHSLKVGASKSAITAHLWDFGGQEFLHQTHQFFFSERSIYLVVLGGRQRQPMPEAQYWLRLIRTYGSGSPVVIALNKIKEHPFTIDEFFLQENYPEVKAVVRTDCDPRIGIEPLRKLLGNLAGKMPGVREKILPTWARVRSRLEEMDSSFVKFEDYREICATEGVKMAEDQETLATILDCLGIALNYRDDPRLRDTSVLKPRWLVDGIYKILRWLHREETNGQMSLADFPKALKSRKEYPPHMHQFLLALMEKFELCFPLENEDGLFLVPGLLDENQPRDFKDLIGAEAQRIQLRYDDVRPPGLIPRFIVRSHTLSEKQPRWLRGAVLTRRSARALVRGDHEGRLTDVFASGENPDDRIWLTEFILSEMRVLNEKLRARTFVEDQPGVWTELEILRDAARREERTRVERTADGNTVMVNVVQRLREVESPEASTPRTNPLSLFICYAHANERVVKRLIPSIKVLARRGYIRPWQDTYLVPGEDWDETIKQRLSHAHIILFMVSRDFLASRYITEHERPLAMQLMNQKKAVVVPVLLSKCSWHEEDFAKFEKLPRKDELISSINPREDAWALVEEGLKRLVEKMRFSGVSRTKHLVESGWSSEEDDLTPMR
jgi:internalin A